MKVVYWAVKERPKAGHYSIIFWTKQDMSNIIEFKSVTTDKEKLRNKIAVITGLNKFELVFIREESQ